MLGSYDERGLFHHEKRHGDDSDWGYLLNHKASSPFSPEREHVEDLILEAQRYHRIAELTKGNSRLGGPLLDFGSVLVKVGCELERLGFGRLAPQQVRTGAAVDCGCA
jgi:hypothetical protein